VERKRRAMDCYRHAFRGRNDPMYKRVMELGRFRGSQVFADFAEAFYLVREVI